MRPASGHAEWTALRRLRYECFVTECRFTPASADHAARELDDGLDATGLTLVALRAGTVVGTIRAHFGPARSLPYAELFDDGLAEAPATFVSKLAVHASERGSGCAVRLACSIVGVVANEGVRWIRLACAPRLVPFYERFGARPIGRAIIEVDGYGPQQPLLLDVADRNCSLQSELPDKERSGCEHSRRAKTYRADTQLGSGARSGG